MARSRVVDIPPPEEVGTRDGLAYALFLPEGEPRGGVLILHGAGSQKESHYDFARECRAAGLAAVAFDMRGHGASEGELGRGAIEDLATVAELLPEGAPRAVRGSSMGGYFAIVGAERVGAAAVVAICPAGAEALRRGLRSGSYELRADVDALDALFAEHDEMLAAEMLDAPLLLLHAEGDERVPVEHSQDLHRAARASRLIVVPGGHHRSVQHDAELQATALRWLGKELRRG